MPTGPGQCQKNRKKKGNEIAMCSFGWNLPTAPVSRARWPRRSAVCLGIPGRVLAVAEGPLRLGRVAFGPVVKEVALAFVPEAAVGDYVLVHAGTALEVIDPEAARQVFELIEQWDPGPERRP
jgi:hydrogenase expression/formation protein HypC